MNLGCRNANVPSIHCTIHLMQLCVKDGVMAQSGVTRLLSKCRSLASFLNRSPRGYAIFKKKQAAQLGISISTTRVLFQDVETRWDSSFLMLKRIHDLAETVVIYLHADDECDIEFAVFDWELMKSVLHALGPFHDATETLSSNEWSVSQIPYIVLSV